jgi:hypothetical protein
MHEMRLMHKLQYCNLKVCSVAMQVDRKEENESKKSRASKRKAHRAICNEQQEESDDEYDWEADHEDCDWAAHPAECIIAVTSKGKYVVSVRFVFTTLDHLCVVHYACQDDVC